jgi:GntR family transcriptional regulator
VINLNIVLSNQSDKPIYQQITDQVRESILKGDLQEGDLLPSIRSLAKDLRISVITTKRAYDELEQEGFIISTVGKGSFVAPKNLDLLREVNLRQLEELLQQALELSIECNLTTDDLIKMISLFSNEGAEHNDND